MDVTRGDYIPKTMIAIDLENLTKLRLRLGLWDVRAVIYGTCDHGNKHHTRSARGYNYTLSVRPNHLQLATPCTGVVDYTQIMSHEAA